MTKHFQFSFLMLIFAMAGLIPEVHAQPAQAVTATSAIDSQSYLEGNAVLPNIKPQQKTHPENILLGHYKLSDIIPDYDALIQQSPLILKASEVDKTAIALAEFNRISNNFNLRDPKEEIIVHTTLGLDKYSKMHNTIFFDEFHAATFFNYSIYGENIAVIPKNIEAFSHIKISPNYADMVAETLKNQREISAEFILVPDYADKTKPIIYNETSYWLMSADIAELRLWFNPASISRQLLWYYKAPWYTPDDISDLDALHSMM